MNTIDQFRSQISPVRPNMFEVSIIFPPFLQGMRATEQVKWHVQSTVIPSGNTGEAIANFKGSSLKLAGDNTYADWTVTFLNNADFEIYKAVQRWREFCRSDLVGTRANDLSYKTTSTVEQLDGAQSADPVRNRRHRA